MQERVIENWLTNANELSFTVPFAQVLALQGHRIVYISPKKATLEQGKDIISVDPSGAVHCYQLKGGDVTLERWRSELKPEVEALTDLPPRHPSLDSDVDWICHLVVNGEFRGEATREVVDTQSARVAAGRKTFDVMVRGELLRTFCDLYGSYLPRELDDFTAFIDMYREDGAEPVNKASLARLLESFFSGALMPSSKKPTKNAIRQQINAAVVSVSYLLSGKDRKKNHVAILEGWLLAVCYIFCVAEKNQLEERYWRPAIEVIDQVIAGAVEDLLAEMEGRSHYAMPAPIPYADAYVYRIRVTIVAGYLAAYSLYGLLKKEDRRAFVSRVKELLDTLLDPFLLVMSGEVLAPHVAVIALFYGRVGQTDKAQFLLGSCIKAIVEVRNVGGLYDPYTDVQDIIRSELGITLTPVERSLGANSYVLQSFVLAAADLGLRDVLTAWWCPITHVQMQEFKPAEPWQWFLWHCEKGKQEGRFPPEAQSWRELVEFARTPDDAIIASTMRHNPCYLPLLFCLMPHRMSGYATRTLLSALAGQES